MSDVQEKISRLRAQAAKADALEAAQAALPQAETDLSIQAEKVASAEKKLADEKAVLHTRQGKVNALKIALGIPVRQKKAEG